MIEIILTVYQHRDNVRSFDILQNFESIPQDSKFSLKFNNLDEAKAAIIDLTKVSDADFKFEDLGNNIYLAHIRRPKLVTQSLFLSSRKKCKYKFIPIEALELENLPPHLHLIITTIKSKLIKLPAVHANFGGAAGRSQDWQSGFGFIPAADLPPEDWKKISDFIIELDPTHPRFSQNENGDIYSPNGSQYKRVGQGLNFGELEIVVAEKIPAEIAQQLGMKRGSDGIFFQTPTKKIKTDDTLSDTFTIQQTKKVTKRNYQKVKSRQQQHYGKKRSCTQASLYDNVSANQAAAAAAAEIASYADIPNIKREWTHLIAHEMNGLQAIENIVNASKDCNTVMMHIEAAIKWLATQGHIMKLKVEADIFKTPLGKKYNLAKMIHYSIEINGSHVFTFDLDPFLNITPPKNFYKVLRAYFSCKITNSSDKAIKTAPTSIFFANKNSEMKIPDAISPREMPKKNLLTDFR